VDGPSVAEAVSLLSDEAFAVWFARLCRANGHDDGLSVRKKGQGWKSALSITGSLAQLAMACPWTGQEAW
jgi:hypothetical protein